jgi:predicted TIM-barrel fold metal-dependent hydrolase
MGLTNRGPFNPIIHSRLSSYSEIFLAFLTHINWGPTLGSEEILSFLFDRGVSYIVGLQYAHKPGIARELNHYMASLCADYDRLVGMATLYPGEPDAAAILTEGFSLGLKGVKLHAHVQCFDMRSEGMKTVYRVCSDHGRPLVLFMQDGNPKARRIPVILI